ncbi:hypothetical protein ASG40_19850 [Methylobacterium sp. Leaf399]|nr:hypothetical protein ASG40_19850 [Methylobacterium sp. Leaf399]
MGQVLHGSATTTELINEIRYEAAPDRSRSGHRAVHVEVERVRAALDRWEDESAYERDRARALWGLTDIWGIPLV